MNIYIMRHGQTNLNKEKRYNCRIDEDINDIGEKQAIEKIEEIKNLNIDIIFCSPMKRAIHTMNLINTANIPVIYEDRLMERIGGVLTGTILDDYYYEEFYNYYSKNIVDGLESLPELFNRVHSFISELEKRTENNILIVTHGAVAKAIQFYFEEIPKDGFLLNTNEQKNCEIKCYKVI